MIDTVFWFWKRIWEHKRVSTIDHPNLSTKISQHCVVTHSGAIQKYPCLAWFCTAQLW